MTSVEKANQALNQLNNPQLSAVEEIKNLEVIRIAMAALQDQDTIEKCDNAISDHANERTFLVACHQEKFDLAGLIHQTASLKLKDLVTTEGFSPMHMAANAGNIEFMKYLEKYDVPFDSEAKTPKGWTPLHSACLKGQPECITYLLQHGANAERSAGPQKLTPEELVKRSNKDAAIKAFAEAKIKDHNK